MTSLHQHRTAVGPSPPFPGALTCTANEPAPTNGDVSNTVGGGRSGQTCAVLTF